MKKAVEVEPLTKNSGEGVLKRRDEVDAQISEVLGLESADVLARVGISDFKDPAFVKHEVVVFLIRHYQKIGTDDLINSLVALFIARLTRPIEKRISFIGQNLIEDCHGDVIYNIFRPILDLETDDGDYAQVNFWPWFTNRIIDSVRIYFRVQGKEAKTDSVTTNDDEEAVELEDTSSSFRAESEEYFLQWNVVKKALNDLTHNEKIAFLMRHYWGFEVENQDPAVPTISKHLGATPRTIRNWLNSAEKKIAKWKDQQGA